MSTQDWSLSGGMPPELEAEQRRLKRQQMVADAMLSRSQTPYQPQMAGGYVTPYSPFQGAAQMLSAYVAKRKQDDVDKGMADLGTRYRTGMTDELSRYQQAKAGVPGSTETIVDEQANDGEGAPATITAPAVPGDPRKAVTEAMVSQYPQVRRLAEVDLQQLNRQEDRRDTQTFRAQEAQLAREQRTADLQARLADARITAQERMTLQRELAQMQIDARRDMAGLAASLRQPQAPVAVIGPDGKPVLVSPGDAVGRQPWNKKEDIAKLPAPALKLQQEEVDAINTAGSIQADVTALRQQIEGGKLKLGLATNLTGQAKNFMGVSDENSRNLASFRASIEKLRNDSLRLNKGVQTEGDAVRAMNELISNINDPKVVSQRLEEIRRINERAVALRRNNIDIIRRNYGVQPLDTSAAEKQRPVVGNDGGGFRILGTE